MDREDRLRIKKNYELLVQDLGPLLHNILDAFYGQGIINFEMIEEIEKPVTESGRCRELLKRMLKTGALKKEHLVFKTFCDALNRNSSKELTETLMETDISEDRDAEEEATASVPDNGTDTGASGDACGDHGATGSTIVISNSRSFHVGNKYTYNNYK